MTLIERYQLEKSKPTPAQEFITLIAEATCREAATVRQWLSGIQQPSQKAKERIAMTLRMPIEELFPPENEGNSGEYNMSKEEKQ